MQTSTGIPKAFWTRQAQRLMRRLNTAWWGGAFLPLFLGATIALSLAILFFRRNEFPLTHLAVLYGAGLVIAAGAAWIWTRNRFCSMRDALARLDAHLHLYNQLSTAAEGAGPWPAPSEHPLPITWRKVRVAARLH